MPITSGIRLLPTMCVADVPTKINTRWREAFASLACVRQRTDDKSGSGHRVAGTYWNSIDREMKIIMNRNMTRRALVRNGFITGALLPVGALFSCRMAIAAPTALDPGDPTAKTLGYVTKSAKPDQQCDNCSQFQGKSGDAQGGCTIFPDKSVAAGGWCMSWVKKLAT
jgi:hypothetical protein